MKYAFKIQVLLAALVLCFGLAACSKKASTTSSGGSGTLQLSVKVYNSGTGTNATARAFSATRTPRELALPQPSAFVNSSIASGPPDSLTINITQMQLSGTDSSGNPLSTPIFYDANGKSISIVGSHVDLSAMYSNFSCLDNSGNPYTLTASQTNCDCGFDQNNQPLASTTDSQGRTICPQDTNSTIKPGSGGKIATMSAGAGTYTSLAVTFQRQAQVSGCVSGNFNHSSAGQLTTGIHTFCTQAASSMINNSGGATSSASFENVTPQTVNFDLQGGTSASTGTNGGTFTVTFPLASNLTLGTGASAPLTLMIDTNRMLRFYANENGNPIPNTPSATSYFFTSVFNHSLYIFAGLPGSIYGYELVALACVNQDGSKPALTSVASYDCSAATSRPAATENVGVVAAWLTVVADSTGVPFMGNITPDDDDTLTVIKGNNQTLISGQSGWDKTAFTTNTDGTYNFQYNLDSSHVGTLYNVPIGASAVVGASINNVIYQGFNTGWFGSGGSTTNVPSYGGVSAWRKL